MRLVGTEFTTAYHDYKKRKKKNTTGELDAVMNCNDGGEKRGLKVSRKKKFTVI
jgi:hypothetical protein